MGFPFPIAMTPDSETPVRTRKTQNRHLSQVRPQGDRFVDRRIYYFPITQWYRICLASKRFNEPVPGLYGMGAPSLASFARGGGRTNVR